MKLNYIIIPLITITTSIVGGWFTSQGMNGWYEELVKPKWTPEGSFIGGMWTFIYALVTAIVLLYWNRHQDDKNFKIIISLFVLNALLNVTWSLSFFTLNLLAVSFLHIIILNLTTISIMIFLWPKSKILSLSLLPYVIWVIVASVLNYSIYILN